MALKQILSRLKEEHEVTHAAIAVEMGLHPTAFSKRLSGITRWGVEEAQQLRDVLRRFGIDASIDELFPITERPEAKKVLVADHRSGAHQQKSRTVAAST